MQKTPAEELDGQVQEAAAHVHAAMAQLTRLAAEFEAQDVSCEWGFSSCAHWLSVAGGFDVYTGREILRVGQALRSLPKLRQAFAAGVLSLDKLRAITRVATPVDEHVWLEIGEATSGAQLIRICREFHKVLRPDEAEKLEAQRGLDFEQRLDGLVTIRARLLPEEAEIVSAAIEKVHREQPPPDGRDWNSRDADAFVEAFRRTLSTPEPAENPAARIVVHVDESVLKAGASGRCHGRFRLSAEAARELACDGEVQYQAERDGVPIDLGQARRVVSPQLARALRARDGGCVFPGCGRRKVHSHHIEHWAHGGKTDLRNLVSLCAFHHHQLHRGAFGIIGMPRRLKFQTRDGKPIGSPPRSASGKPPPVTGNPSPPLYTPRMQFRYAKGIIEDAVQFANRTTGPPVPTG